MASLTQIQTDVNSAKVYAMQQMALNLTLLKNGQSAPGVKDITALKRMIRCLTFQINANVNDANTNTLYTCLLNILAGFTAGYTPNPSVIIPGQTIVVTVSGSKVNVNQIPFTAQTTISLAAYQTGFYPIYGNNPYVQIFVSDGAGGFTPDTGTAPDYVYQTPGVPTSGISSITWSYGVAVSGFVLISGVQPN